jgi:probable phosphoglycerate mutase
MTRLVLVRHGVTETTGKVLPGRTASLHLSTEGQDQAERLGMRLSGMDVAAVYASPLERTRETAAPISRACGVRTRTGQGLIECDFGDWTGQSLSKLRKLPEWEAVQKTPSLFRFPKGESFAEMQTRMWAQLNQLADHHKGSTVVAVSHADTIKAAVAMASGTPLDLFQRYVISPCSATLLLFTGAGPMVLAVNTNGEGLGDLRLA